MAFDQPTRNRLATFVKKARDLITEEFTQKFAERFGIADDGTCAPLEKLTHLDEPGLATAALLRQRIDYLVNSHPEERAGRAAAVKRLAREQAFTVLNRLAALRMAEKRGLILESVGKGYQSKGYKLYATVAGTGLGETYERYRRYLFCLCDELAVDLGALFDRHSPHGILFPREPALLGLLDLLNAADLEHLWAEDETIGWIYQYYNDESERKKMREQSSAPRNSRELAVRNQFFTPRYVVEFLTDNTLGRIWYEMTQGETSLRERCRYLVRRPTEIFLKAGEVAPEAASTDGLSQEELLRAPVHIPHRPLKDPRELRMLDPACGSMHFGLYAFDLFEVIYAEAWDRGCETLKKDFPDRAALLREVPRLVVENNIHGVDIDPRAAQIAALSLWLRAQKSWSQQGLAAAARPRITRSHIVCAEPMPGDKALLADFVANAFPAAERPVFQHLLERIFDHMQLAGEAGSLLKIEEEIRTAIEEAKTLWEKSRTVTRELFSTETINATLRPGTQQELGGLESAVSQLGAKADFWESAEERIYQALRGYSEQAETTGSVQRRLFANDAAQGFAFIDLCRKRYDVAVMNPPFGSFSKPWSAQSRIAYPNSYNDILGAFVERFLHRLHKNGRLGAITSRTCFFLSSFKDWRLKVVLEQSAIRAIADLGQGVMDNAMVEAAAYVIENTRPTSRTTVFRAIADSDRKAALERCIDAHCAALAEPNLFLAAQDDFHLLPDSPFVYWITGKTIRQFTSGKTFEPDCGNVRQGLATGDDPRYVRAVWEVASEDTIFCYYPTNGDSFCRFDDPIVQAYFLRRNRGTPRWAFHIKSGASQPWYSPITLKINWAQDGEELKNFKNEKGKLRSRPQNIGFFYRPGFSWTRRAVRFYPYTIPGSCIPSVSRYMAFPDHGMHAEAIGVCASRLVSSFLRFYGEKFEFPNFLVDTLKMLPWPDLPVAAKKHFESLVAEEVEKRRVAYQNHEPFHEFLVPVKIRDFSQKGQSLSFDGAKLLDDATEAMVANAYGFNREQAQTVERDLLEALSYRSSAGPAEVDTPGASVVSEENDTEDAESDDDSDFVLDYSPAAQEAAHLSYLVGCAFGRWDIRFATGKCKPPALPHPFAPLPVCPPGLLQDTAGLPCDVSDAPADYPINVCWSGILVDEENHPFDFTARAQEALKVIWKEDAERVESTACASMGIASLRDYFSKPNRFFADHLAKYTKSKRKAPIYWPLSTKSGTYTLWIYYQRLSDQTLHTAIADFVEPKIKAVEATVASARAANRTGELADAQEFLDELRDFKAELERITKLPWKPNLNDGVLITASPLWKLFRLPKWQKDLKACWEELERGDYDWAHLAYTIWPKRVEEACKTDRSLAIAHGLEHLCQVEPPKPKAKRGKKAKAAEQPELSEETE